MSYFATQVNGKIRPDLGSNLIIWLETKSCRILQPKLMVKYDRT